jgi:pilus assembly protein FimV
LNAEIEIVALRPGEEDTLAARIAPLEAFEAAGVEPSAMLNTVRFAIERRNGGRIVRVTTTQPINEPFVELLVELQSQHGRLVREYTFLLDPAEYPPLPRRRHRHRSRSRPRRRPSLKNPRLQLQQRPKNPQQPPRRRSRRPRSRRRR